MPTRTKKTKSPAAAVDAQLERYREMRDFSTTAEPRGSGTRGAAKTPAPSDGLPFVIQKHAATRLHYDFRLGWNGVLKSWAVAKGPSYVVADKRLAVQVEDHPMEYGGFEGTIPKGQYGGGTVMLWDTGTWEPVGDANEGFRTGRLKFILHGHKLKGHWTLIRMGGKAAQESKPNWLLIKEHDEYERTADDPPIVDEAPNSVITHRDLDAIASASDHVWDSRTGLAADERAKAAGSQKKPAKKRTSVSIPKSAKAEALPKFIAPQLASAAERPPTGKDWLHELKLDGYRMQARIEDGTIQLLTRSGLDWTRRMRPVADALQPLSVKAAILDGEVIVLDERGISSFAALQAAFQEGAKHALHYYIFDLLHLDGHNLRPLPLLERKALLADLIQGLDDDTIRLSEHVRDEKASIFDEACRHGAEGVVSKRADGAYISGRSASWVKVKCGLRQEFVIGGFTLPSKGGNGIGALLLGYYQDGKLIYAGRTGTGFTQTSQKQIRERLESIRSDKNPFLSINTAERRGAHWVKPQLVAEVAFSTWTADNMVRQASFKGLRDDKPANEVVRENASAGIPNARTTSRSRHDHAAAAKAHTSPPLPRVTHPDKVVDRESGLTKQQLVTYYAEAAPHILPYIVDRPLSIVRCPSGTAAKCFFQKHVKPGLPKGIGSVEIVDRKSGKPEPYITLSDASVIAELGQLNVFELHPWGAPASDFEHPDRIIFDLDPDPSIDWKTLAATATEVRARLQKLGLESFLKSTGGKGLHIVAPIQCQHDWPTVKEFAHRFVLTMEAEDPSLYITKMTKAARTGRIYLDYLRNERGATAVAPYSPRSRSGVPVSVPMAWSELKADAPPRCLVAEFDEWRKRLAHDPWAELPKTKQRLTQKAISAVT
ncbi:MAG TPA: DNA ligase D [Acidobacteriaceae bacterium]|jgi:bifunctional non-homologous end joining protein LigD